MKTYTSHSDIETKQIAKNLASTVKQGVITLTGELGAGKTTFVQGFAKGLGIKDKIISPTFVLMRQHKIPNSNKMLFHIDLYRLEDTSQIKNLGIDELINDSNNLILIEWAEKLKDFPEDIVNVAIERKEGDKRVIIIS